MLIYHNNVHHNLSRHSILCKTLQQFFYWINKCSKQIISHKITKKNIFQAVWVTVRVRTNLKKKIMCRVRSAPPHNTGAFVHYMKFFLRLIIQIVLYSRIYGTFWFQNFYYFSGSSTEVCHIWNTFLDCESSYVTSSV